MDRVAKEGSRISEYYDGKIAALYDLGLISEEEYAAYRSKRSWSQERAAE